MVTVSSWGRLERPEHKVIPLTDRRLALPHVAGEGGQDLPGLAYGMGRSYGDVCLNPGGLLWQTAGLDRLIDFDEATGILLCEAGVLLRDIQRLMTGRGWMLPVSPGTQIVTVGGAIANDVHGKNHHRHGSFGDHVTHLTLLRTSGEQIECSSTHNPEWFAATVGGLGLTGLIVSAAIQLRRVAGPWLDTETLPYYSLDEFFMLSDSSEAEWEYTVSWIDCLVKKGSRGLFMRANHASLTGADRPVPPSRQRVLPFTPPVSLVNRLSLRPFNFLYFNAKKDAPAQALAYYESFFYPLDNLLEWNRMYGPHGFYQYQCAVPRHVGKEAISAMLAEIAHSGEGSFLTVLKTFGDRIAPGMLSFARPGVTLALDFPNNGPVTRQLLQRLDRIVRKAGGRIYPAKDARMTSELFQAGYPRLPEFLNYRDPGISSAMSRRLMGY